MSADPRGVVGGGNPTGAPTILPALARKPGEYEASYRERQIIALGTEDKTSLTHREWAEARRARGGIECSPECALCWRSELHRRGLVKMEAARG